MPAGETVRHPLDGPLGAICPRRAVVFLGQQRDDCDWQSDAVSSALTASVVDGGKG